MTFKFARTDREVISDLESWYHTLPEDDDLAEMREQRMYENIDEAWDESVMRRINKNGHLEVLD